MHWLEAFFMYFGISFLIIQAYFAVPFLAFYIVLSMVRPDFELSPQDL